MSIAVLRYGFHGQHKVYKLSKWYAVSLSRKGARALMKKGQLKRGQWWPIYSLHTTRAKAKLVVSDAVANGEWPKGYLIIVPVMAGSELHNGIFT